MLINKTFSKIAIVVKLTFITVVSYFVFTELATTFPECPTDPTNLFSK